MTLAGLEDAFPGGGCILPPYVLTELVAIIPGPPGVIEEFPCAGGGRIPDG